MERDMRRKALFWLTALSLAATTPLAAQEGEAAWDGLVKVHAKKLD